MFCKMFLLNGVVDQRKAVAVLLSHARMEIVYVKTYSWIFDILINGNNSW